MRIPCVNAVIQIWSNKVFVVAKADKTGITSDIIGFSKKDSVVTRLLQNYYNPQKKRLCY